MPRLPFFGKPAANEAADRILASAMQTARDPDLFGDARVPDTMDGRFELATVFAVLVLLRLKAAPEADKVAQSFTDSLFRLFDAGLRESGVGDLSVARRMKGLAGAFYGRVGAYTASMDSAADLAVALGRNIWGDEGAPFALSLAQHLLALHAIQMSKPPSALETAGAWDVPA